MASFKEFLTIEGERLLAKALSGEIKLSFTRMEIGDGDRGNKSKSITSLESPKMELDIYSVKISGDNTIQITCILESKSIETGFYFREKGLYASDGINEILFMYGTSGSFANFIENNALSVFTRTIRTLITVSEGDSTNNIIVQDGTFVSGEDMDKTRNDILNAISNIQNEGDWAKYKQAEQIIDILDKFCSVYTALRASKIDNIDTQISSRAPASSALSNEVWTDGRAALLDKLANLDTTVSSRAPASTALSNTVWTNKRAGYLDYLANGTYGLASLYNKLNELLNRGSGDVNGKKLSVEIIHVNLQENEWANVKSYTNSKGGFIRFAMGPAESTAKSKVVINLIVDGVTVIQEEALSAVAGLANISYNTLETYGGKLDIPFKKSFEINAKDIEGTPYDPVACILYYINP